MFKKLAIAATVLTLAVALTGCGGNKAPQSTKTNQNPTINSSQLPPGHPGTGTTSQSANVPKVDQAKVESMINDMLNQKYPGDWKVSGNTLSKGNYTENNNFKIVNDVNALFNDNAMVTIFVGNERVSSTVMQNNLAALKDYPVPEEVGKTFKDGKTISATSPGMGGSGTYLKVYMPLKAGDKTVAVMSVSVPQ